MLVLTRRKGEKVLIRAAGIEISVSLLEVDRHGQIKLGIDAPQSARILRGELVAEVTDANRSAVADGAVASTLESLAWVGRPPEAGRH